MLLAAFSGASSAQAFLVYRCGFDLCRANSDGSRQQQLTSDGANPGRSYVSPSLSRDGTKLAYIVDTSGQGPGGALYVLDTTTGTVSPPIEAHANQVFMKPDGSQLAVISFRFNGFTSQFEPDLVTYNVDGSNFALQSRNAITAGWSGDQLLRDDDTALSGSCPSGSGAACLATCVVASSGDCANDVAVDANRDLLNPAVSPDGSLLALTAAAGPTYSNSAIALFDPSTGQLVRDLTVQGSDSHPAWSPDGSALVFDHDNALDEIAAGGGAAHQVVALGSDATWGGGDTAGSSGSGGTGTSVIGGGSTGTDGGGTGTGGRSIDEIRGLKLAARRVRAGKPLTFEVTLKASAKVTLQILRFVPASGRGRHRRKARYVFVGTLTFSGKSGFNKLRVSKVHGRGLAAARYEAKVSAGGKLHLLSFKIGH